MSHFGRHSHHTKFHILLCVASRDRAALVQFGGSVAVRWKASNGSGFGSHMLEGMGFVCVSSQFQQKIWFRVSLSSSPFLCVKARPSVIWPFLIGVSRTSWSLLRTEILKNIESAAISTWSCGQSSVKVRLVIRGLNSAKLPPFPRL